MLELLPPHGRSLDTGIKKHGSVNGIPVIIFLWSLTACLILKAIVLDSMSSLRPTIRTRTKLRSRISLPPELTDEIIFHLRNDKKSLETCSRVCKSWLPASRYCLFRVVSLQLPVSEQRIEFLKTSIDILVPCARHLHIQGVELGSFMVPRAIERIIPLLTPLTRVEALHLCNLDIRDLHTTLIPVTSAFTVTQLELYDIVFHDVNEMTHFISQFTQLTRLDICPQFRTNTHLASTACRLPVGVHSIGYAVGVTGEGSEICDWITLSKEQIHFLDLGIYSAFVDYGYHRILSGLLETLEPYLRHVDISFIDGQLKEGGARHKDLKLSQHFQSRSVVAHLSRALGHQSLSDLLFLVPTPVSNIVIEVPGPEALYAEDWSKVDDFLDNSRFSELRDLSFQLPGTLWETPLHKTFLESSLKKCYTKGILRTT